jgi:hypothetical protein
VKAQRNHEQDAPGVQAEHAPARRQQDSGDRGARVEAGAALAERQRRPAGRPRARGVLAADEPEEFDEPAFAHDYRRDSTVPAVVTGTRVTV